MSLYHAIKQIKCKVQMARENKEFSAVAILLQMILLKRTLA
jgi:hypothetical protein